MHVIKEVSRPVSMHILAIASFMLVLGKAGITGNVLRFQHIPMGSDRFPDSAEFFCPSLLPKVDLGLWKTEKPHLGVQLCNKVEVQHKL